MQVLRSSSFCSIKGSLSIVVTRKRLRNRDTIYSVGNPYLSLVSRSSVLQQVVIHRGQGYSFSWQPHLCLRYLCYSTEGGRHLAPRLGEHRKCPLRRSYQPARNQASVRAGSQTPRSESIKQHLCIMRQERNTGPFYCLTLFSRVSADVDANVTVAIENLQPRVVVSTLYCCM